MADIINLVQNYGFPWAVATILLGASIKLAIRRWQAYESQWNRIERLNEARLAEYKTTKRVYERYSNRCPYCKTKYVMQEAKTNCLNCGSVLPDYQWPEAPPFRVVLQ